MLCEFCKIEKATENHHMFQNSKANRKKFGSSLIDDYRNLRPACNGCNGSHRNISTWHERHFCRVVGILDCRYCSHNFIYQDGDSICVWSDNQNAEACRQFDFDKDKYYVE